MRRIALLLALVGLVVGTLTVPAVAAPAKSEVVAVDCGADGIIDILVRTDNSGAPTFDASLATNGRQFVLSFLEARFYAGVHPEEPAGIPDFVFSKTWGNRKGYERMLTCVSEPFATQDPDGNPFTAFFHVVLAGK